MRRMAVTPAVEERAGCGRGARAAALLMRWTLRPLIVRLPWSPLLLRLAPFLDAAAVLMVAPRGTRVAGCRAWRAGPSGSGPRGCRGTRGG